MKTRQPKWNGLAINGGVALLIGLIFIFLPHELTLLFVKIFGVVLAISGLGMLFVNFFRYKKGALDLYYLIQGLLNLGLGAIMIFEPKLMVDFIMLVIGMWAVTIGIFQIIYAISVRKIVNSGLFLLANGVVFIGLGLIMILNPEVVIKTMIGIVGVLISALGIALLYFSYLIYKSNKFSSYEIIDDDQSEIEIL